MSRSSARLLHWSPRILTIAFALFLSVFALDVFNGNEAHSFWQTLAAFLIHLIPAGTVALALALAWRREWIGTVLFGTLSGAYAWSVLPRHVEWALIIGTPLLLIAGLFLTDWIERAKIRSAL